MGNKYYKLDLKTVKKKKKKPQITALTVEYIALRRQVEGNLENVAEFFG